MRRYMTKMEKKRRRGIIFMLSVRLCRKGGRWGGEESRVGGLVFGGLKEGEEGRGGDRQGVE